MSAESKINKVLQTDLLMKTLVTVPTGGSSVAAINEQENKIGDTFSVALRALLQRWNGLDLEVIRLFACEGGVTEQIYRMQLPELRFKKMVCFGSDPSGFLFCEDRDGRVFSFDTDGGNLKKMADDIDSFFDRVVFGSDGIQFSGVEWLNELKSFGLA